MAQVINNEYGCTVLPISEKKAPQMATQEIAAEYLTREQLVCYKPFICYE